MARNQVPCEINSTTIEGRPGVEATCTECGHTTQSFGDGEPSIKRCLALMREECPEGQSNFYVDADDDN